MQHQLFLSKRAKGGGVLDWGRNRESAQGRRIGAKSQKVSDPYLRMTWSSSVCLTESKANDDGQQSVRQKRGEQHGGMTLFLKKREKKRQEAKAKDVGATASFIRFGVMQVFPTLLCLPPRGGVLPEF